MKARIGIVIVVLSLCCSTLSVGHSFQCGGAVNQNIGQTAIGIGNTQTGINSANVIGLFNGVNQNVGQGAIGIGNTQTGVNLANMYGLYNSLNQNINQNALGIGNTQNAYNSANVIGGLNNINQGVSNGIQPGLSGYLTGTTSGLGTFTTYSGASGSGTSMTISV